MRAEELESLARQEERHWWFRARRRILARLLASPSRRRGAPRAAVDAVVDLGCGAGFDLDELASGAACRVGVEAAPAPLRAARERGGRSALQCVRGRAEAVPLRTATFDMALALDVIEHLEDDAAALREAARLLKPGGRLVVTAPAFPALWSQHDEALGHRRRYRRGQLARLVAGGGFEIERATYFNTLLFPLAAIWRLCSRRRRGSWVSCAGTPRPAVSDARRWGIRGGAVLEGIFALERFWLPRFNLPFGLSLLVVARKSEPGG